MFNELNKVYGTMNNSLQPNADLGTFEGIAGLIANVLVGSAISISFITLAFAFVQFTLAQGDPKSVDKAQHAALWSAVAMVVALLAFAVKSMVFKALGAPENA